MSLFIASVENIGFFYIWDETIRSTGWQEIISYLFKYIETVDGKKDKIIIYRDTYTQKDRNMKLA